jgi:hypothetical protein
MGEGGDGGVRVADITPTFVLPHPGGGKDKGQEGDEQEPLRKYVAGIENRSTQL